jgi:superfamily I DNA and/or RNA helicase
MSKNKKSINFTSKDIITTRDTICKTKTKYWRIIKSENIIPIKAKNAGMGTGFDLKMLYNKITQMSDNLIKVKLILNAINSGISEFDFEEAKNTHYYNIYKACELKEMLAHWEEILKKHTLNPTAKSKAGKKGLGKIETFTSAKVSAIIKKLQREINAVDKKIADFNETATIAIADADENMLETISA